MVCPEYVSGEHSQSNPSGVSTTFGVSGNNCFDVAILLESSKARYGRPFLCQKRETASGIVVVGDDFVCSKFLFGKFSGSRKEYTAGIGSLFVGLLARSRVRRMVFLRLRLEFMAASTGGPSSGGILVHGIYFCIDGMVPSYHHGAINKY